MPFTFHSPFLLKENTVLTPRSSWAVTEQCLTWKTIDNWQHKAPQSFTNCSVVKAHPKQTLLKCVSPGAVCSTSLHWVTLQRQSYSLSCSLPSELLVSLPQHRVWGERSLWGLHQTGSVSPRLCIFNRAPKTSTSLRHQPINIHRACERKLIIIVRERCGDGKYIFTHQANEAQRACLRDGADVSYHH